MQEKKPIKKKSARKKIWALVIIILLILGVLAYIQMWPIPLIDKCDDGTWEGRCSPNKPWYCEKITLVKNSNKCGCPEGYTSNEWGTCNIE